MITVVYYGDDNSVKAQFGGIGQVLTSPGSPIFTLMSALTGGERTTIYLKPGERLEYVSASEELA